MRGFTLIELLLVIAIITIMAGLSIPFVQNTQTTADLDSQGQLILGLVRRAQGQSISGQNQSAWGLYFDDGNRSVILFRGDDFNNRDQDFDYNIYYPNTVNVTTDFGNQIFFPLYSLEPSASGTIQIITNNQQSRKIIVNGYGKTQAGQ
ncbi:MAG: prepilin-type N-terminal cleavage/methylation domain-containing protein [Candidatus Buchananbacteria bacterium]|nr:prepilin-type N-terminal cleavage/methylation domain-containing protein [Candidatus Buchananbacteria bacterium]